MAILLFIFLGIIAFIDLNLNILVCNAKCKWQKTQFVYERGMKRLQNMCRKLAETRYIYVLLHANNNSIRILQNMDIDPNHEYTNLTRQFRIYHHIFFLSILFYLNIFQYILIYMIYNKRIAQYLQISESSVYHIQVHYKNHK